VALPLVSEANCLCLKIHVGKGNRFVIDGEVEGWPASWGKPHLRKKRKMRFNSAAQRSHGRRGDFWKVGITDRSGTRKCGLGPRNRRNVVAGGGRGG